MQLHFELSTSQLKQIASYISLQDIQNCIQNNPKEYERMITKDTITNAKDDVSNNIQKNYNNKWSQFVDDTICIAKVENNTERGEKSEKSKNYY